MNGKSDPENGLRDSSLVEENKNELAAPSLSPLSLSSCAGALVVQAYASPNPVKGIRTIDLSQSIISTPGGTDKAQSEGMKLELPMVYNNLKYSHFRSTSAVSFLVTKRRRVDVQETFNLLSTLNLNENIEKENLNQLTTGPALDKSRSTTAVSSKLKRSRKCAFFNHRINEEVPSAPTQKKGTSTTGKHYQYTENLWDNLQAIFKWAREHTATGSEQIKQMATDWDDFGTERKRVSFKEISDLFSISTEQLQDFKLFDDLKLGSMLPKLRNLVNHLVYSDLTKVLAFREWQSDSGSLSKCAYYLAEAHGTHLRSDMVDKHCLFLSKSEINQNQEDHDKMRKKVFVRQIKDALTFGRKFEEFMTCINDINPNWNIIQITAMAFGNNRFGSEAADFKQTPSLFLTSFLTLPSDKKRSNFVTYIKEPSTDASSRMPNGILEEFKKVMTKNRHINDEYVGCRKKYWDIRAEHNKHLSDIILAMEENWLGPFAVLLAGNIKDGAFQEKIMLKLYDIQTHAGRKLTMQEKVFLYKLMENYDMLGQKTKTKLREALRTFLQISLKRAKLIADIVSVVGNEIPADVERWPTIIILDSELEQLPWDWMPVLRTTSVTRMASVAAIYSAVKVMKISRPKFPEVVDISKCTFILNPDQTLINVQKRLESYLQGHKKWKGIVGRKPTHEEMEIALQNNDIMIYCGHGSGINFFPEFALQKLLCNAVPILMGCSSAQYRYHGPKANSSSIVSSYLIAACPSIVGFLWEVTDVECDRVTVDMLQRWLPGSKKIPTFAQFDPKLERPREKCLATAMLQSRKAATQFLTEAALVNYGLPIETK